MTTNTSQLKFTDFIGMLNGAMTVQLRAGYERNAIRLDAANFKYTLKANSMLQSCFFDFEYRDGIVHNFQTPLLHVDQRMLDVVNVVDWVLDEVLRNAAADIKIVLNRAAVTTAIEAQHLTVGRIVDLPHGYPQMYSTVYAKRVMLTSQRLSGYGALDFQVAAGGATPTDDFTVIAAYNALLPDGTKSETVHLPWIGCTLKELETFDLVLRNIIDVLVEVTSCR